MLMQKEETDTSSISFTAHYTGHIWYNYGLSEHFFATMPGRFLFNTLRPFEWAGRMLFGSDIKSCLLQRHYLIDHILEKAIEEQGYTQVLEVACGLSPRGFRFMKKYADQDIRYIEADLPGMAKRKEALLSKHKTLDETHKVIVCNILEKDGEHSIKQVVERELDPGRKTIVITEGLIMYFSLEVIKGFWERLHTHMSQLPEVRYLADNYPLSRKHPLYKIMRFIEHSLGFLSRADVNFHFANERDVSDYFADIGFEAMCHDPKDYFDKTDMPQNRSAEFVHVIDAKILRANSD